MTRILYSTLFFIICPFFLYGLFKSKQDKPSYNFRWKELFGITMPTNGMSPLWIHAVSVGEVIAVTPLIRRIKTKYPELPIVVTTTTTTGAAQVEKLGALVEHRYMPLDFSFAVNSFLKAVQPSQLLIMETELWPNTLHCVSRRKTPITVLNARLSQKSANNYRKILPLFNIAASAVTRFLCQSTSDSQRFVELGVPSKKIHVTGSIKFDISINNRCIEDAKQLRETLGQQRKIWIAASTHQGEDEQVLNAHNKILERFPDALLILVPRHPERFSSVHELCQQAGFSIVRRSCKTELSGSTQVYLGDTMGEMMLLLGAADLCFMGGSLAGNKVGGHNIIEPMALGKYTLTGPSYFNFQAIIDEFLTENVMSVVDDENELSDKLITLFSQPEQVPTSSTIKQAVEKQVGAIDRTIQYLNLS
ncbi:3-deoxy-D-manno-octulosonic-acid transferase [Vibrio sp. N418]|uniref:lipid IV(A) 3-deoxy-D-manno-octulosonic acid transferase n=1 Tax=Vibrio sp. (strain N418) TaxID=701176 RepID=UPI00021BD860|nr:lipid IV(A) 3-deoxy-D-manno-octulosonic acid transferase [Vibrio sp. N418]EGU33650.1 3-deoxy-D-manno-octulosonic-acid transferase [Vibrio sp. N418]